MVRGSARWSRTAAAAGLSAGVARAEASLPSAGAGWLDA